MARFQERVKIYAIYINDRKIFIVCSENSAGSEAMEKYAESRGRQKPIVTSYEFIHRDRNYIYFNHVYEPGIKCESDSMIWDCFDGSIPKCVYLYDEMETVHEKHWKKFSFSDETEIKDGLGIIEYIYVDFIKNSKKYRQ